MSLKYEKFLSQTKQNFHLNQYFTSQASENFKVRYLYNTTTIPLFVLYLITYIKERIYIYIHIYIYSFFE